jgi:predicted DNA-binding protein (MmcQ/YjbR family)
MNVDEIRAYCLAFPDATENIQWADDLCFKVRGKIFTTVALTAVPQKLCFKCTPETFAELVEREDTHPAPYVGRYKWVILDRLDVLRSDELRDLIRQSYEMVAAKAPGKTKALKHGRDETTTRNRNRKKIAASRRRKKKP